MSKLARLPLVPTLMTLIRWAPLEPQLRATMIRPNLVTFAPRLNVPTNLPSTLTRTSPEVFDFVAT